MIWVHLPFLTSRRLLHDFYQTEFQLLRTQKYSPRITMRFYRKNRNTNDMVFTLRSLQYSYMEKNIPLYLGFIDIAKPYDSVDQPTLWKILYAIGILTKMLSLIKTLFSNNNCKIKFGNTYSNPFKLLEGLKQGCPAACIFFNIFFGIVIAHTS